MFSPSATRLRVFSWVITFLLPAAAWSLARYSLPYFHPGVGVFFIAAACISAVIGGPPAAIAGTLLNTAALVGFSYLYHPAISTTSPQPRPPLPVPLACLLALPRP